MVGVVVSFLAFHLQDPGSHPTEALRVFGVSGTYRQWTLLVNVKD